MLFLQILNNVYNYSQMWQHAANDHEIFLTNSVQKYFIRFKLTIFYFDCRQV